MGAVGSNKRSAPLVAIVSTLRDAAPVLRSFITYHQAIGFERFFLFFDDPSDSSIAIAKSFPSVTVIPNDEELHARWRTSARFPDAARVLTAEPMARQLLNVDMAIQMALESGIDWLLHIDVDELFYIPAGDAPDHFQELTRRGIRRVEYRNHEAVPETAVIYDYFREVTLFKNNYVATAYRYENRRAELAAQVAQLPPKFFHFYSNGKSAAQVRPGLVAPGAHGFRQREERQWPLTAVHELLRSRWYRALGKTRPGLYRVVKTSAYKMLRARDSRSPAILHYACCGFGHFWAKYRTLGAFGDQRWAQGDIRSTIGAFHVDARDVVATGDKPAGLRFYEERMVIDDEALTERLIAEGVLLRIRGPAELLAKADAT